MVISGFCADAAVVLGLCKLQKYDTALIKTSQHLRHALNSNVFLSSFTKKIKNMPF